MTFGSTVRVMECCSWGLAGQDAALAQYLPTSEVRACGLRDVKPCFDVEWLVGSGESRVVDHWWNGCVTW